MFKQPLLLKSKRTHVRVTGLCVQIFTFTRSCAGFYNVFRAQGPKFGSDIWMEFLLIHGCAHCLKIDHGEFNNCR